VLTIGMPTALSQVPAGNGVLQNSSSVDRLLQGRERYTAGEFEAAIALWQQALEESRSQGEQDKVAIALTYLSLAHQQLGHWSEAETMITQSLRILNSGAIASTTQSSLLAQALNTRGQLEFALGKTETALASWEQATNLYRQLQDEAGVTGSLMNQAQAMESLGLYRRACMTVLKAIGINHLCEATESPAVSPILQQVEASANPEIQVLALRSLGNIFRLLGHLDASQKVLDQGLIIAQSLNSSQEIAATLMSIGNLHRAVYHQVKDLHDRTGLESDRDAVTRGVYQALESYQKAIALSEEHSALKTIHVQAQLDRLSLLINFCQWSIGKVIPADLETTKSLIQDQIRTLLQGEIAEMPPSLVAIYARIHFAQSVIHYGIAAAEINSEAIEQNLQIALQQAEALQNQRVQSHVLGALGQLYESLAQSGQVSNWQNAQQFTEPALGLAQAIQAWEIAYQWQWQLGRIYRAQGNLQRAIAHYEAATETLKSVRADLRAIETEVQFSFRDDVEPVYREFVTLLLQARPHENPQQENLRQVIRQVDALQLSELENFLQCNLTASVEISEDKIDPMAAIIYPIILEDQLVVIARSPKSDQLHFHHILISKKDVDQTLTTLRQELEKRYLSETMLSLSQQVYDWLIRPIQPLLASSNIQTLVFVLDGTLRNIPMATLHNGQQFLIEQYAVAVSPSLQLVEPKPLSAEQLNVLTFGLSQIRTNFLPHQDFAPLSNVEAELATIDSEVSGRILLNQHFTSSTFQNLIRSESFPIVHLATHGQFSSKPEETFVLAWDKRITLTDLSNILQHRDQINPQPIELLVLSACKTADGDSRATLGLAGVAIQSGARSTIASLWYVDDRATADLMGYFYQELAKIEQQGSSTEASLTHPRPFTRAEALRQAQIALLRTPSYRAPVYWAPYILAGNWL
jgi:CHAT domain-containing protein